MLIAIIIIISLLIAYKIFSPSKGNKGEKKVAKELMKLPNEYHVFNDITIRSDFGTTQIDHVVVSKYGIFVIETKNYSGIITGHENNYYWTQNIWGNKFKLRNPIKQNFSHIISLKEITKDLPHIPFFSIVVFTDRAGYDVTTINSKVTNCSHIVDYIESFKVSYANCKMLDDYIDTIHNALLDVSDEDVKNHKKIVRKHISEIERQIENDICPRCGGKLIHRNGNFGSFYGCSNYPKCKFTINV